MDKILKLYTYNGDTVESTPFPNELEQVVITDFQYDANRMGGSPSISATVMHRLCLDDLWTDNVYAEFNGERYFVMNTPSSNKDNDDTRYEHEVELLSEREVLNHIYFIDAVQGDSTVDVYKSNSTKVIFMGDINEFASRLNSSLSYSKVGYNVVVDEGIVTEAKLVSFEDKYIMSALQEIFNIYEIPYYFVGKTIHIGYTDNAIPNVFKYGFEDALLSISKNNANYEVVRRCTGIGSSDNIPYYYPNESDDRAAIEASGKKWITPAQNLMPPIYRETKGAERFYNAVNDTYPSPEGGYYTFENLYSTRTPNEKIVSFEDIKPSIVGMTNASGQRIDQFIDIAFDLNDNDELDEEGNYIHPYFFVKLPKYNGSFGFNLFDQAIEQGAMTISMTSGVCGACNFEIGVGEETNKNIVQVDENGNLKRDENGNVLWENQVPQDRQNDTQNYEVWIALKKDDTTYGQIMPNASQNLKPSVGDTFVILNINLPQSYILTAEEKLKDSIIKYMFLNNNERFTFSVNFSRIYFAENPDVLAMMNENARILIEYNNKQHTLYISSFSYKMSKDNPLPEISIELTDELSVGQNSLQNALDAVKNDILSTIGGGDFLKQGLKYFLRKDKADTANGRITFNAGLKTKAHSHFGDTIDSMIAGKGTLITDDGRVQTRRLEVSGSMTVMELVLNEIYAMMGDFSFSDCGHIEKVEFVSDSTYKLWIRKDTEFDFTTLDENDILYSIVNNLKTGGTDYYTSWMRVLTKNVNDNTLTIVLYPDEEVPGGKNYPPVAGYNLTRRGNSILPDEGQINERAQSWLLSSREGRIMFLANVYKPILEDYNYAISIGKFPQIEAIANLPISETDMGIMAKTIVCEQLYRYDYNGDIISNKVDRGEWSLTVAQSDQPYRFIQHDRLYPDGQHTYTELEQHTVYHYGCKWGCLVDKTQDEPVWNSPSWSLLEGDKNYHLDFESSNGWQYFIQQVNTDIKAVVSYGNRDITNILMATTGVEVEWLRDTGNIPSDNSWKPTYVDGQKHVIHLSVADMGSGWGSEYRKISFICRVFIPVGEEFETVENSINIKI